jgi:CheY-like chemotaxis protein
MAYTCLIAANDPWFIQLIRVYSLECGLKSAEAFVSHDILPAIHLDHPSVILLQADLPGHLHGLELVGSIRKDPAAWNIPIIVFYSQAVSITPEVAAIASTCIQEPVSFGAFEEALAKVGIPVAGRHGLSGVGINGDPDPGNGPEKKHPKKKRKPSQ